MLIRNCSSVYIGASYPNTLNSQNSNGVTMSLRSSTDVVIVDTGIGIDIVDIFYIESSLTSRNSYE